MAKISKQVTRLQSGDPDKIFIKNMTVLQEKDPVLFQRIADLPFDPHYQVYRNHPKAPYNLFYMKNDTPVPYYDMNDALGGAEKEVDDLSLKNTRVALFLGFGLGYEVLHFFNSYFYTQKTRIVIIAEYDLHIFRLALETTDLTDILRRKEVMLFVGLSVDEAMERFRKHFFLLDNLVLIKCMGVIVSSSALRMYPEYYNEFSAGYRDSTMQIYLKGGDSPQDSLLGESHMFANLKHIVENPGVNMLHNKFAGKPAIVCGSGPSLQKELQLLKQYVGKVLILSAESTLWSLSKADIYPNMICTLERDKKPDEYFTEFEYEKIKDTYLAAVPVIHPMLYDNYAGPKINAYRAFAHFSWLPFDKGMYGIGMSSANMAFKLAHKMGCSPIILIGQDLCYDRDTKATHAPGHVFGEQQEFYSKDEQLELMANDGQMSPTTRVWKLFYGNYLDDVPGYHREVPGGLIINTSEKGVRIPGTVYMPFEEAAAKYLTEPYDPRAAIREELGKFTLSDAKNDVAKLRTRTGEALSDLKELHSFCMESIEEVDKYLLDFKDDYLNLNFTLGRKKQLATAAQKITDRRSKVFTKHSFTFNMLVMHVVQTVYISFGIDHEYKLGNFPNEEGKNWFTIFNNREFFLSMAAAIDEVQKVVEVGQEVVNTLEYL